MEWLIVGTLTACASAILFVLWATWEVLKGYSPADHFLGKPFADVTLDEDSDGLTLSGKIRGVRVNETLLDEVLNRTRFNDEVDSDGKPWVGGPCAPAQSAYGTTEKIRGVTHPVQDHSALFNREDMPPIPYRYDPKANTTPSQPD